MSQQDLGNSCRWGNQRARAKNAQLVTRLTWSSALEDGSFWQVHLVLTSQSRTCVIDVRNGRFQLFTTVPAINLVN